MTFSLDSLYEDFQKLENIWTTSNSGLPLVRYTGCTFKFYQTENVDYFVIYDTCWPMVDTPYTHADSAPGSILLKKRKITVPSRKTQANKKPYKKVRIHPPTQMQTHWYFQRDICKTPLLMLTTTTVSLTNPFCDPKATSNNISLQCLNPYVFTNVNFQTFPQISGYFCRMAEDQHDHREYPMYLWATNTPVTEALTINKSNIDRYPLTPLANTLDYQEGKEMNVNNIDNYENNRKSWGNPFYHHHLHPDESTILISNLSPTEAVLLYKKTIDKSFSLTLPSGPIIYTVRYQPDTDKGDTNRCYLVSTSKQEGTDEPENTNLIFEGFPLPILLWGWTDWVRKAKLIQQIDENSLLVVKTKMFDIQLSKYIFLDKDFIEGFDPYKEQTHDGQPPPLSEWSKKHWFPKLQFQDQSIEKICMSGKACPRVPYNQYMQIYCRYKFHFKWGGCPKVLEKASNPCLQSVWPTPDTIHGRLEIKNPDTAPQTELYDWDWEGDYVTTESIKRIQESTTTDKSTFTSTESKNQPKTTKKVQKEDQTWKEEEKTLLQQFLQLKQQREQLQQLLLNRIST